MTTRQDDFVNMMYPILNGWMWNFYTALPHVCEAVMSEKIILNNYDDADIEAHKLVNEEHDLDSVSGALNTIAILAFGSPKWGMFNDLGVMDEDSNEFGFTEVELTNLFANNPKGASQALFDGQKGLMGKGVK